MSKFIDFGTHEYDTHEYSRDMVPSHAQESIENYLMHGWKPGGFMSAMFAGDLFTAAGSGDQANGPAMQGIARWIMHSAPNGSWGSYEVIENWVKDVGNIRTRFSDKMEKEYIIKALKA
jgi:hypothetical protein